MQLSSTTRQTLPLLKARAPDCTAKSTSLCRYRESGPRVRARASAQWNLPQGWPTRQAETRPVTREKQQPLQLTQRIDIGLRSWVEANGGEVLPTLALVDSTPTLGCRGVVVTRPLSREEADAVPLLVIPESLYMTTDQAREMLSSLAAVRSDLAGGAKELPAAAQLGLLLAVERRRGDDSFWAPYIHSLPDDVPCGWALSKQQLTATLDALRPTLGARLEGWAPAVERAGKGVEAVAEAAVKRYGRHLEGDLDVADVVWGMGQVLSRSFGGGADLGMAPYIDLLNHREGAPKPRGFVDSDDDDAGGRSFVVIDSSLHGEPQALAAGEEAFISYAAAEAGGDPLQAFLNLGFVPPELVRQRAGARGP